jgi:predicted MFS family arabinose efflux permease
VDIPGIVAITVTLTSLVLALVEGNQWGWASAGILGLFALSVAGLVAFGVIERRSASPIVDFAFFRSRSFAGANLVGFFVSFAMFAMFFFLALYMQNILGYSPLQTGVRFLPSTVMVIAMGPIAGRLTDRIGPRPLIVGGLVLISASMLWQSRIQVDTGFGYLLPAFVTMGLGIGLVMSPMSTAGMNAVDRSKAGVASGVLSMSRMVGGTFGVAALGALVAAIGRHDLTQSLPRVGGAARDRLVDGLGSGAGMEHVAPTVKAASFQAFVDALGTGLTVSAAAALVAAVAAWWLIDPHRPSRSEAVPAVEGEPAPVAA